MKTKRQAKIIELIGQYRIETQEELAERLNKAGIHVTQATISRDIRELHLTKVADSMGHQYYTVIGSQDSGKTERLTRVFRDGFRSMETAMNMLVIHTVEGMAMAVAASLDHMNWSEIIGCIAGDDTIFVAVRSVEEAELVKEKLRQMLEM